MRTVFSTFAIVAASFAAPIAASLRDLAVRDSKVSSVYSISPLIGGPGGIEFSDLNDWPTKIAAPNIIKFSIQGGDRVDKIFYDVIFPGGESKPFKHGGDGGKPIELILNDGEFINKVEVAKDDSTTHKPFQGYVGSVRVFWMRVTTNFNATVDRGILTSQEVQVFTPPKGYTKLVGFEGREKDEIDAIAAIWG